MTRIARERIDDLFALARAGARDPSSPFPDRYVRLARRVGTRYNVRTPGEYRDSYCRHCSVYWVEGRTVRTRLRSGRRVQTCLRCGAIRRRQATSGRSAGADPDSSGPPPARQSEAVPVDLEETDESLLDDGDGEDL